MRRFSTRFSSAYPLALFALLADAAPTPEDPTQDVRCVPVAERGDRKLGCYVTATQEIGLLGATSVYWHIYSYPTRAAAESLRGRNAMVVESLGRVWGFAIAEAGWKASSGERVARVGPLPVTSAVKYTAVYRRGSSCPECGLAFTDIPVRRPGTCSPGSSASKHPGRDRSCGLERAASSRRARRWC